MTKEYDAAYYKRHRDKSIARSKKYYAENSERVIRRICEQQKKNIERVRTRNRKRNYALTKDQFNDLVEAQQNCCPCCLREQWEFGIFHVDHNHITGEVRGLLCSQCNTALGMVKDNPDILKRLIQYLKVSDG